MSAKLEEGDLKGAVRLASSEDTQAPMNEATLEALEGKHPSDFTIPSAKDTSVLSQRTQLEVLMGSDPNI